MNLLRDYSMRDILPYGTQRVLDLVRRRWGIRLGRGCEFYGVPIFRRGPGSTVRIGRGTVVGAGGVPTKSLQGGVLATGIPARVIKELDTSEEAVCRQP
jgi:hypothetical protein